MKCKIVLLNPPTAYESTEILLNLAYLSSALKEKGHEVLIIDATAPFDRLSEDDVRQKILDYKPHFIGITLTIDFIPQTYQFIKRLRQLQIPIVAGGPHANSMPEEVIENGSDIVAIGEGEATIVELADHFIKGTELKNISGICYKNNDNSIHFNPKRQLFKDLDQIPFPDFDSFPIKKYTGVDDPDSNPIFWSIFSSRGCPFRCIFCCSHNMFGQSYRTRSPQNLIQEIEQLSEKYGAKNIAFQDDEAFIQKKRIIEFCNLVKKSKKKYKFSARLRIDSLNEEMLSEMKSIGFSRLSFGIESFNDESLKNINKKYNTEKIGKGFEILEKIKFNAVYFNNLIGFPWETPEHLRVHADNISKIPDSIVFMCSSATLIPYPKTELYEKYHEQFGFTNWWLDPEKNSPELIPKKLKAYYLLFLKDQIALYKKDIFWNHPPEMRKAIKNFCWETSSIFLKRFLNSYEFKFVYVFSRISHWLWEKSPILENILLKPVELLTKALKLVEKVSYREK